MNESAWPWRAIVLAAFLFVIAAAFVVYYLSVPTDGVVMDAAEDGGVRIVAVEAGSPGEAAGLRGGDRLLAIGDIAAQGGSIEELRVFADRTTNEHRVGQTVVFRIARAGAELAVPVRLGGLSRASLFSHLLLYGSLWVVAWFLIWARRSAQHVEALAITIFVVTAGQLLRLTQPDIRTPPGFLIEQTGILCRAFGPVLLVHFGTVFPVATLSTRVRYLVVGTAAAVVTPVLLIRETLLMSATLTGELSYAPQMGGTMGRIHWWAAYWIAAGAILTLAALLIRASGRLADRKQRDQIKWFLWAIAAAGTLDAMLMTFVMIRLGHYPETLGTYRNLLYLLVPLGLLLSIFRHDLFDVDAVIRRSAVYFGTTLALFIAFTGSESLLSEALGGFFTTMSGTARSVVSGILAAMLFVPVRSGLERMLRPRSSTTAESQGRSLGASDA